MIIGIRGNFVPVIILNNTFVNYTDAHSFNVTAGVSDGDFACQKQVC